MASQKSILLVTLLVTALLAGCASGDDNSSTPTTTPTTTTTGTPTPTTATTPTTPTPTTPMPEEAEYNLTTSGIPAILKAGTEFTFTLTINGTPEATSEHIGAHFANNMTSTPKPPGRGDCTHTSGTVPGEFNVTCTLATPGVWYVFGHMQTNMTGEIQNHWAEPQMVSAYDYTLTVADTPPIAIAGVAFTFELTTEGEFPSNSTHIGAHYADNTTAAPVASAMKTCDHAEGSAPGTYTVTCTIEEPGTWHIYGHYQIESAGTKLNFWADPFELTVA